MRSRKDEGGAHGRYDEARRVGVHAHGADRCGTKLSRSDHGGGQGLGSGVVAAGRKTDARKVRARASVGSGKGGGGRGGGGWRTCRRGNSTHRRGGRVRASDARPVGGYGASHRAKRGTGTGSYRGICGSSTGPGPPAGWGIELSRADRQRQEPRAAGSDGPRSQVGRDVTRHGSRQSRGVAAQACIRGCHVGGRGVGRGANTTGAARAGGQDRADRRASGTQRGARRDGRGQREARGGRKHVIAL
mmetsp:Transcript_31423/g.78892  ORF Transcript_31423/g.78892 Transcript_31423/m.78892 type:complete len:246 (-) Transcript_31423:1145-1882(-)